MSSTNTAQAERSRVRGQNAQGRVKSAAYHHREIFRLFSCQQLESCSYGLTIYGVTAARMKQKF